MATTKSKRELWKLKFIVNYNREEGFTLGAKGKELIAVSQCNKVFEWECGGIRRYREMVKGALEVKVYCQL